MDFKLVVGDNQQGIYIDNKLILENHSLSAEDVLKYFENYEEEAFKYLNDNYDNNNNNLNFYEIDQCYIEELGNLPNNFNDINNNFLYKE